MVIVFLIAKINKNPYFPKKIYGKILSASYFLRSYDEVRCFFIETDIRVILS